MTIQELANLCQFKLVGDVAVGVYKGYPVTLRVTGGGGRDILSLGFKLEKAVPTKVIKLIRKSLPKGTKAASVTSGLLSVTCICNYKKDGDNAGSGDDAFYLVSQMLDASVEAFHTPKNPLMPQQRCACCGKSDCDSAALVGEAYLPVHRECVLNRSEKEADKAQKNEESGNYFLGFIGAFLGALIGCIPNILLILFAEVEYGILHAIIPFASFIGYKLFRGKLGAKGRVIVILCSLIGFIVMQPTQYFIGFKMEGYDYSLLEIFILYFTNMTITDIIADTWFGILFLCIGIGSAAKTLGSSNHDAIMAANASIDSIVSLNGGSGDMQYAAADTYGDGKDSVDIK